MTNPRDVSQRLKTLPKARRLAIIRRAAEIEVDIANRTKARDAVGVNATQLARAMGVKAKALLQIERDADQLITALSGAIQARGGSLEILVTLPGSEPIRLSSLGGLVDDRNLEAEGQSA